MRKQYHQNFYKSIPRHLSRFQRMKMVNEYEREKRLQYCSINAFSLISTQICVNAVNIKADLKAYEVKHPSVIKLAISTTFFVSGKRRHFEENLRRLDRRSDIAWQEHFLPKCYQIYTIKALMNATNQLKENMDYCSRWIVVGRRMLPRKPKLKIRFESMVLGRSNLRVQRFYLLQQMQHPWKETNTQFPVPGDGLAK